MHLYSRRISKLLKIIFFLLITVWFFLAFSRTLYNLKKFVFDDSLLVFTSSSEQRPGIFGEEYKVFEHISNLTKRNSKILFVTTDSRHLSGFSYESLYFLYPRKIKISKNIMESERIVKSYNYDLLIFIYPKKMYPTKEIKKFKSKLLISHNQMYESENLRWEFIKYE